MALVTLDGGQSSSAVAGQTAQYIHQQAILQLPGCPDTLVDAQLQLALKHFYTFTTGWRKIVGPYAISAGNDTIHLNPADQDSQVQFVHETWLYPFLSGNTRQYLVPTTNKIVGNDKNPPSTFFMQGPATLVLYPVPDKAYGNVLFAHVSLIPTPNSVRLPDISFTHHIEGILAGLFMRLYRMPKKPWTDQELAADYRKTYSRELLVWRDFANRNYGPRAVQTVFPPFAGRGSQMTQRAILG